MAEATEAGDLAVEADPLDTSLAALAIAVLVEVVVAEEALRLVGHLEDTAEVGIDLLRLEVTDLHLLLHLVITVDLIIMYITVTDTVTAGLVE